MRTALYARVSTLNSQDPEMQLRELREFAARRGCGPRCVDPLEFSFESIYSRAEQSRLCQSVRLCRARTQFLATRALLGSRAGFVDAVRCWRQ